MRHPIRIARHCLRVSCFSLAAMVGWPSAQAQTVPLATGPLYAATAANPNVIVTASVEFPTVGPAYLNVPYSSATAYVGYFDPTKCYDYVTANAATYGEYFAVSSGSGGTADASHQCTGARVSGSFMNWATMSAIDEFRYAMTGGNRVVENGPNGGTIVERAMLPDESVAGIPDFYNSSWFPRQAIPPNTTPFGTNYSVANCKQLVFVGTAFGGSCNNRTVANGATYFVRVLVCDAAEGPFRPDLCLQYGGSTGKYKPVGQAQVNAASMRFAVFGYLLDRNSGSYNASLNCPDQGNTWNRCRYGGVLRSAMKYLGPTKYDATGISSSNANAEINADGTLVINPDLNAIVAGGYSGFINYINKFGSSGVYKLYDPMGEMYYEAIRYMQGLQPTADALAFNNTINSTAQAVVYDNFPVVPTWSEPILTACSKNYIINLSDTNTNDDVYFPGYTGTPSNGFRPASRAVGADGLNVIDWTAKVGVLESTTTPSLVAGDVNPSLANLETLTTGFHQASYGAVGAAYWANTNDIRPLMDGKQTVKTISVDVNEAPSGSSPPTGQSQKRALWLMGKYGDFTNTIDRAGDGTQANPFYALDPANPNGSAIRSNSEWADPAVPTDPAGYLLASNPNKLISGLRSAFAQIGANAGTAAGAALTSSSLDLASGAAYVANFKASRWSGTVLYEGVSSTAAGVFNVSSPLWDAGALLTARCGTGSASTVCTDTDASVNKRNIVTTIVSSGTRVAKSFTFANLATDANYLLALNANPAGGNADSKGPQRLNYLRGYRGDESSALAFRTRDSVMGDIINSAPVYEGPPTSGITDADYQGFFSGNVGRTAAVYVGANDGMLHAFNAVTGVELFAYIPNFVSSYLADLTNPGYQHEPFVDSTPIVREAKVNGTWRTVLLSGAGAGGQGVFALDVTDPTGFGPNNVIFEFSDADDADFGNVVFSPEIVKLQTGTSAGIPTYGYFAAVTGYNNRRAVCKSPGNIALLTSRGITPATTPACTSNSQGDAYVSSDTANRGVLFLLSLDRTLGTAWVENNNYYKYYFPANSPTSANGLGAISALTSSTGSGAAAALYFGDLQGDLWRFNTVGLRSAWAPSLGTVGSAQPLFVASPSPNVYQPITARPELGSGPFGSTLVVFGTGRYLGSPDLDTPYAQQSEYGLIDDNGGSITRSIIRSDLQSRTASLSGTRITVTGSAFSYSGGGSKKGWYIDFPGTGAGERMVNKAAVTPGLLSFTSLTLANDICGSGGGYIYLVNPLTGLPLSGNIGGYVSTVGIPGPPAIVDLASTPGQTRATGEQISLKKRTIIVSGTAGNIDSVKDQNANAQVSVTGKASPVGRVSWREITNYNDRH